MPHIKKQPPASAATVAAAAAVTAMTIKKIQLRKNKKFKGSSYENISFTYLWNCVEHFRSAELSSRDGNFAWIPGIGLSLRKAFHVYLFISVFVLYSHSSEVFFLLLIFSLLDRVFHIEERCYNLPLLLSCYRCERKIETEKQHTQCIFAMFAYVYTSKIWFQHRPIAFYSNSIRRMMFEWL